MLADAFIAQNQIIFISKIVGFILNYNKNAVISFFSIFQ